MRLAPRLILIGCVALWTGCGPRPASDVGTSAAVGTRSRGTIGVSVLSLTNPFFKVIADGITEEAGKRGFDVVVTSGELDVARQQNQVKDFLVRKVAAIILCPCDSRGIGPSIAEANAAGVPVFTADIACLAPGVEVVSHIATDNFGGGEQAGQALTEAIPNGGKVVILDFRQAESCLQRVDGFKKTVKAWNDAHPGAGRFEIVAELPCEGKKDQGYRSAEDALQSHPDLAAIFAINDPSALGARAAVEKAGKADQVRIIGFDGQPEGIRAIDEGKIFADPVQDPARIGRESVAAVLSYFRGDDVPPTTLIPTTLYRKGGSASPGPR